MKVRSLAAAAAVLCLGLGSGCPTAPGAHGPGRRHTQVPGPSDLEGIREQSLEIQPSGPPVAGYGTAVEHALTPVEQAIADRLRRQPMTHRPALSRMVRELAATTPDRLNVPPSLVDGLMAWSGLVDPPPRLTVVEMPEDPDGCHERVDPRCEPALDSLVEQVVATLPDVQPLSWGVGVAHLPDGRTRMMVAVLEVAVDLRAMPLSTNDGVDVKGRLLGSRSKPSVEVVGPDGRWQRRPTSLSVDGRFSARVACDGGKGAYQVEVLADGVHGIEVAANFPIYCGEPAPRTIPVMVETLDPSVTAEQIARANFLFLNEERALRGLPALAWDADAAAVAYGHSEDMLEHGFVGHVSPTTGDVTARFGRAGLQGAVIRENVARGYGPRGIHQSLMGSPGHRANLLATDVTHVGIGVVVGKPETSMEGAPRPVFVTQNFYKQPGAGVPSGDLGGALRSRIDERREQASIPAVGWDDGLSEIAQRFADAVGKGKPAPKGYEQEVFALGYTSVEVHRVSSIDFDAIAGVELWAQPSLRAGVGVVRTKDKGGGETFVVVVLVGIKE